MRRAAALAVVLSLAACRGSVPGPELETFPDQGRAHTAEPAPEYNSDPPTSGPHAPVVARCGIYRQEVPDVVAVHNLEHGVVVIQYRTNISADQVERLEELARSLGDHTLVAPRRRLPAPIVVTAWTQMLRLHELDEPAIRAFHDEYAARGPELRACPFEVDEASS